MTTVSRPIENALLGRAARVIPGGVWGHQNTRFLSPDHPQFIASSKDAYMFDVDGRRYVDLMCAWGPMILGYQNPVVDEAVRKQMLVGDTQNGPSPRAIELAELLVDTIDHADWAILAKNGTDATTACLTIARAATSREVVLAARGSYHGALPWCTPQLDGVIPADRVAMGYFDYNDSASLDAAVAVADGNLAAIIITPFKHIEGLDNEDIQVEFAQRIREICDRTGAVLVLDDVRCGFRLNVGGSWEPIGVKPDLSAWSKALANGYSIAAIVGSDALRDAASRVFLTGSFWTSAVPMAAAIATISELRTTDAFSVMTQAGQRLRAGLLGQSASYGLQVRYTGPATMPYLTFAGDTEWERMQLFSRACLTAGLYVHPRHNWFLSAAHTEEVIDEALLATDHAFSAVAKRYCTDVVLESPSSSTERIKNASKR
jgi:glutamate-1-semialdehyde 2,1-aminomutase